MTRADAAFPTRDRSADRERLRDEIARQHDLLARGPWRRNLLIFCGYGFCALFVSPFLMLTLAAIDMGAEMASLRLLRRMDPVAQPLRYVASLVLVVVMESCVATASGMVWLVDDPFAKALAAGLGIISLLQLATVRAIHLPYALVGMTVVCAIMVGANLMLWAGMDHPVGMAVTTLAALVAVTYAVLATLSNHALHNASAQALASARASDSAKGLFLAQMSHELRTPLNAIIGLGEVEAAAATGASRDRLQALVTSARGLAGVLDDVLDLSAINTGRLSIVPRATDIRQVLGAVTAIAAPESMLTCRKLVTTILPEVPQHLSLDAQRLRQCLTNLIGNALKYAGCANIQVHVGHFGGRLEIEVSDDGPGVAPEVARTLFEPFRRGNTLEPGLGLGLAISRRLARQMGGDLSLLPSDRGALFRLVVAAPICEAPQASERPDLTGRRVLVVDDVATNRLVASVLLRALGAEVVEAESGAEALDLLERAAPDLVFLDMAMPDMDGFETFRRMRLAPAGPVPVFAMTAGALAEQRAAIAAAGMDGFIAKPLLPEALATLVAPFGRSATEGKRHPTPGTG